MGLYQSGTLKNEEADSKILFRTGQMRKREFSCLLPISAFPFSLCVALINALLKQPL
jgi:hypothetical protein